MPPSRLTRLLCCWLSLLLVCQPVMANLAPVTVADFGNLMVTASDMNSGGKLTITSGGDQTYEGMHIKSGGPTELTSTDGSVHFALAFNEAGNLGVDGMTNSKTHVGFNAWADGGMAHVLTHAAVGAMVGKLTDGNAAAGAAAGALNEALTPGLDSSLGDSGKWRTAGSQLAGGYAAMLAGGSANTGGSIAKQADGYNRQLHKDEMDALLQAANGYADLQGVSRNDAIDQLLLQANRTVDAGYNASIKNNTDAEAYLNVVNAQYASTHDGKQLFQTNALTYFDPTAGADHLYEIESLPSLGDGQQNRMRTAMLNGVTSGQASSDAPRETMGVMDWEGRNKSAELGSQATDVLALAVTLPVSGVAGKSVYQGLKFVVKEAIDFGKNPVSYTIRNPVTVATVTEAAIFTAAGVPQANSLLPEVSLARQVGRNAANDAKYLANKLDDFSVPEVASVPGSEPARGVRFFGEQDLEFFTNANPQLGPPKGAFFMSLDDASQIRNEADVLRQTGHSPSVLEAYMADKDIYGLSFKTEGLPVRAPTAEDAGGYLHYLEGGSTAVRLPEPNSGYLLNSTKELFVPGQHTVPQGSILFKLGPNGEWLPVKNY